MLTKEEQKRALVVAARLAFLSVASSLRQKEYALTEYFHEENVLPLSAMIDIKYKLSELATKDRLPDKPTRSQVEDVMRKLGFIFLKNETENGPLYPAFLIMSIPSDESVVRGNNKLEFGGLLSGKTQPAAIDATREFIVEVNDENILPEVETAVKAWRDNLNELFEAGKISACITPKIVLV